MKCIPAAPVFIPEDEFLAAIIPAGDCARVGAKVVINGRRQDILTQAQLQIDASGKKITVVVGDIANPVTAQRMTEAALKHFGGVDILINNAVSSSPRLSSNIRRMRSMPTST